MSKLIACISAYNEEENMVKCLDSLKDVIDGVCLVDGKYFGYLNKSLYSTDATQLVTLNWCNENNKEFKLIRYGGYRQKKKRTQYLQNPCKNPDENTWMFIVDPDNVFEDLGGFREDFLKYANMIKPKKYNYLAIMCSEEQQFGDDRRPFPKDLILRYEPGLKYQPNHWIVSDKNNVLYCATNVSKTHVLPGKVTNRPFDRKNWARKSGRSMYRAVRLLSSPSRWAENFYENGNDCQEKYLENEADIVQFQRQLQYRIDKDPIDLDLGIVNALNWLKNGSQGSPEILNNMDRGRVLGLLITMGFIANPYEGEPEADL